MHICTLINPPNCKIIFIFLPKKQLCSTALKNFATFLPRKQPTDLTASSIHWYSNNPVLTCSHKMVRLLQRLLNAFFFRRHKPSSSSRDHQHSPNKTQTNCTEDTREPSKTCFTCHLMSSVYEVAHSRMKQMFVLIEPLLGSSENYVIGWLGNCVWRHLFVCFAEMGLETITECY